MSVIPGTKLRVKSVGPKCRLKVGEIVVWNSSQREIDIFGDAEPKVTSVTVVRSSGALYKIEPGRGTGCTLEEM